MPRVGAVALRGSALRAELLRVTNVLPLRLVDNAIAQRADLRHLHFHHVAGLEPQRRIAVHARACRRAGPDEIARLERGEGADVVDQPGKAPGETVSGVLLAQLAIDARGQ